MEPALASAHGYIFRLFRQGFSLGLECRTNNARSDCATHRREAEVIKFSSLRDCPADHQYPALQPGPRWRGAAGYLCVANWIQCMVSLVARPPAPAEKSALPIEG